MFVLSWKSSKARMALALSGAALLIGVLVIASGHSGTVQTSAPVTAAEDSQRQAYLQSLGYEVLPNGGEVREILIPAEFDETIAAYNALQQQAGMDLTPYRGKRVKCWTYTVTNVPDNGTVLAHLLLYKDTIVGGDISSTAQGGFSHGLTPAAATETPAS